MARRCLPRDRRPLRLAEQPEETKHLTQRTWARAGGTFTFWGTQASAYLNAGIAEDTDALSAFRLGGGLRMRTEFPLLLRGYNTDEIFARRYLLLNFSYRFPIWPGQDRVYLELLGDYARVAYVTNHHLPRSGLAGVGATLSFALTKGLTLAVGYGYGVDAPRHTASRPRGHHAPRIQVLEAEGLAADGLLLVAALTSLLPRSLSCPGLAAVGSCFSALPCPLACGLSCLFWDFGASCSFRTGAGCGCCF